MAGNQNEAGGQCFWAIYLFSVVYDSNQWRQSAVVFDKVTAT